VNRDSRWLDRGDTRPAWNRAAEQEKAEGGNRNDRERMHGEHVGGGRSSGIASDFAGHERDVVERADARGRSRHG
jgi:hypothetical protein